MNTNEAPIQLSMFLQNRKPTLEQLAAFVKQLLKDKNIGPLVQRMGILLEHQIAPLCRPANAGEPYKIQI